MNNEELRLILIMYYDIIFILNLSYIKFGCKEIFYSNKNKTKFYSIIDN